MMFIVLALVNGLLISLARALNGRLAAQRNAFYASWINHLVGFSALTGLVLVWHGFPDGLVDVPPALYLGGVIGALYVSLNSYIVPKLGVTVATLLVIAGQIVMSIVFDLWLGKQLLLLNSSMLMLIAGTALLVFGFYRLLSTR